MPDHAGCAVNGSDPRADGVSVVIPTRNGARRLPRCLAAVRAQDYRGPVEIVVVDDASTDDTAGVAAAHGARVLRSDANVGPGQARNLGVAAAMHDVLAFTDDDCVPEAGWLTGIVHQIDNGAAAVCGLTLPDGEHSVLLRHLRANNVMLPLAMTFHGERSTLTRAVDYARGLLGIGAIDWERSGPRQVFSAGSGNLATTRRIFEDVGGFDPRFRFSAEDQDLCRRVGAAHPAGLWFTPEARVRHVYRDSLRDTLRRSAAYGAGHMVLREKIPGVGVLVFPVPLAWAAATVALVLTVPRRALLPTLLLPIAYPRYVRGVGRYGVRDAVCFAYLNFLTDSAGNVGVLRHVLGPRRPGADGRRDDP